MKKNKITLINTVSSLFLQFVTVISGFIIPRLILNYFGSEVNGLVSSINQLLNYITLFEGGITTVIAASLYSPLYKNDMQKVSSIIKTSEKFYKKISLIYIIYAMILSFGYPLIIHVPFSYTYVVSLSLILTIRLFVQYCFSLSMKTLLNASKKVYYVCFSQAILEIFSIILSIISLKIFPSIHILKLISAFVFISQPFIYGWKIKRSFNLDKNVKLDNSLIKNRWDGFFINLATFIHWNADVTILTIFSTLKVVSIYSVYSLVSNGIKQIVNAISNATYPSIGRLYAKNNNKELNEKFDTYEFIIFFIVFFLFSVGALLITPFVIIYTTGIKDINYAQYTFGIVLMITEIFNLIKIPYVNIAYSANCFKDMKKYAFGEAVINIILSLLLVKKYGLVGITVATLIAMVYRTFSQVFYLKKNVIYRNITPFFSKLIGFTLIGVISSIVCVKILPFHTITITAWIERGIIYSTIFLINYTIYSLLFFKKELKLCRKYFARH